MCALVTGVQTCALPIYPTDPKSLYWIPTNGGMVLNKLNVETNTSTVAANFAGKLPWADVARVWTKSEGSAYADGRYWCFMAETDAFNISGVFTYDLQTQTVLGTRTITERPDHVSISASGRWLQIHEFGRAECRERVCQ